MRIFERHPSHAIEVDAVFVLQHALHEDRGSGRKLRRADALAAQILDGPLAVPQLLHRLPGQLGEAVEGGVAWTGAGAFADGAAFLRDLRADFLRQIAVLIPAAME